MTNETGRGGGAAHLGSAESVSGKKNRRIILSEKEQPKRKYQTEFGLNMVASHIALLQISDLDKLAEHEEAARTRFHTYMICRRPKIGLEEESIVASETQVAATFFIQRGAQRELIDVTCRNDTGHHPIRIRAPYPHTWYQILDAQEHVIGEGDVGHFLAMVHPKFWTHLSLEVLYVGQAYGAQGERDAPTRLSAHETVQKISLDALKETPDQDLYVVLLAFEPIVMTEIAPSSTAVKASSAEDDAHIERMTSAPVPESQLINYCEAALIRYFAPAYNSQFRAVFPDPRHKSYKMLYELEINSVFVELDTEVIRAQLRSPTRAEQWVHTVSFAMHSADDRAAMLAILDPRHSEAGDE